MSDPMSGGEIGGLFAGAVALLGSIGGAVAWAAGWFERRGKSREDKLDAWHAELEAREERLDAGQTAYTERLATRLAEMEQRERARVAKDEARDLQMTALRIALDLVSGELRRIDGTNPMLAQAASILSAFFPVSAEDLHMPGDMLGSLRLLLNEPGMAKR